MIYVIETSVFTLKIPLQKPLLPVACCIAVLVRDIQVLIKNKIQIYCIYAGPWETNKERGVKRQCSGKC